MVPVLPSDQVPLMVLIFAGATLLAGVIVVGARILMAKRTPGASVVRSWMAISLVLALILLSGAALGIADGNLRSTLIGGLTASVGSAITFYFSSKASDQAHQDLLNATVGTDLIPDLKGKTETEAAAILGKTAFKLQIDPTSPADATVVDSQIPVAGSTSPNGSSITVLLRKA